jgi:nitrite reductase/ring-hydroxylating ferredoxin subunit
VATHVPIIDTLTMPTKVAAYRTYAVGVALPDAGQRGLFWDVADPYHYIRTHVVAGAPTLIVGGEDHKVGEEDDTVVPFERLEAYVLNHFHRPVAATDHRWSGQVLEPVDGLPYIGRVSGRDSTDGHLYLATGYSGNGITGGTLAAMIITDQIRGVDNAYGKLFEPGRVKPVASAAAFIGENVDFPKHLVADHLPRLGKSDLDAVQRLAAGEGVVARVGGNKLAVYRNGRGELSALSPVCTHLGCLVHWNTTEKSWDCPCHGSRFDPLGRVLNGPATAALEAKPLPDELSAAGRGAGAAQPAAPASGKQG